MFTKIELKNFQCYKDATIDFDKGVNAICGESDNGKSAVIRAIKWVVENRPSGIDKLNSHWNEDLKNPMSVKLYTDKGWVERIRSKDRNGYTICYNNKEPIELSAVKTDVPQEIKDFLNVNNVNFQYQLDSPYLISMTSGEASKYLNEIIHLDSIDKLLAEAESDKRNVNSELKVIEKDINALQKEVDSTAWLEEALQVQRRIDKYNDVIEHKQEKCNSLKYSVDSCKMYESKIQDFTEQKNIISEIENISIPENNIGYSISEYKKAQLKIRDFSKQNKIISHIENIEIPDCSKLKLEIESFKKNISIINNCKTNIIELNKQLPDICPVCGAKIEKEVHKCF